MNSLRWLLWLAIALTVSFGGLLVRSWVVSGYPIVMIVPTTRFVDGVVLCSKPLQARFQVENRCGRDLQLTAEHRACGCTQLKTEDGEIVTAGRVIPAGGTLPIIMHVDPRGRRGRSDFLADLTLSDGRRREDVQFRLAATVQEPLLADPDALRLESSVSPVPTRIKLYAADASISVTTLSVTHSASLQVEVVAPSVSVPNAAREDLTGKTAFVGTHLVAELVVTVGAQFAHDRGAELIRVTCGTTGSAVDIPVTRQPSDLLLRAYPQSLTFLSVPGSSEITERTVLFRGCAECLETLSVKTINDSPLIESLVLEPPRGAVRILRVRLRDFESSGLVQSLIVASCDGHNPELCEISVRLIPKSSMEPVISPSPQLNAPSHQER